MDTIIPQNTKHCPRCDTTKPLVDFYQLGTRGGRQKGYDHECKECARKTASSLSRPYRLRRFYGLTAQEYESMWEAQGGRCAICQRHEKDCQEPNVTYRRLVVDHCHKAGKVRGLLCTPCNRSFGMMNEDPERIRGLLAYAEQWHVEG